MINLYILSRLLIAIFCAIPFAQLSAQTSPPLKDYGPKNYLRTSKDLPHSESKPWRLVCTIPYNCHFQPSIELEAPAGLTIQYNSTNPLVLFLLPTETFTTTGGSQQHEAQNWVSGEGAIYTIPAGVTVKSVKYRETGYDTTFAGSFECNDEDYNILWKKAARTAYVCMRDHFYDCPDRERVGFWGDGTPELNQCFYVFDSAAHRLAKDLVLRKLEPKFYPGQHLEFLGDYGLWFYYLQTGDLESIRKVYPQTKEFLFETYQFGNPNTWFDWGKEVKDTAVTEVCFYYNCLGTLKKMALVTGNESDIPAIDEKLAEIKSTFDQKYWQGSYYMSSQVTQPDDRANAMAVNSGLADRDKWPAIYENVLTKKTYASCFFDRWVFEALCTMGKQDYALIRMQQRFKTMIHCSFTTLWEHYDRWWASRIDAFDDQSSLNHGWNPPAIILSKIIAGIAPVEPGWRVYQVMPKEAFLNDLKVVVPTIKGDIALTIKKTTSEYSLNIVSPKDTKAIIGIPKKSFLTLNQIKINNSAIWGDAKIDAPPGIVVLDDDAEYVKFEVEPGTWRFTALGTLSLDSPKAPFVRPVNDVPLEKKSWLATASIPDSTFVFSNNKINIDGSAANAIDGDHWTGWRDTTKTQYSGQWLQVDMKKVQTFDRVELDNTWAQWDSPNKYEITVSNDAETWSSPIATGPGLPGITSISFPKQSARYLRVTQTGTNDKYHWSVFELDVFRKKTAASE